jgi:hypothetical protein
MRQKVGVCGKNLKLGVKECIATAFDGTKGKFTGLEH